MTWIRVAVRLAARCRHLERRNRDLTGALIVANVTCERLRDRCQQYQRDCDLLALMARDKDAAEGIVRDAHRMDGLTEVEG